MKRKKILIMLLILSILVLNCKLLVSQDSIVFNNFNLISDVSNLSTVEGLAGNRNNNIDFGERITLQIGLKALSGDFISTSVFITSKDPYITIKTPKINFDDIKQGEILFGTENLVIDISNEAPHRHNAKISLEIMDSRKKDVNGNYIVFEDEFTITISRVGPIQYGGAIIDDDNIGQSQGNNNMIIEKSDGRIEIPLFLKNIGKATVTDARVTLVSNRNYVTIFENTHQYDFIRSSGDGSTPADYVFSLNNAAPESVPYLPMKLEITGNYEEYIYKWTHEFRLGQFFGKLKINTEPLDAEIIINKRNEGKGMVNLAKVPVDNFVEIEIRKFGYQTETLIVPVVEDKLTDVTVVLAKNAEAKLDLPELNLEKWENYYQEPILLASSKKVLHKGYFWSAIGTAAVGFTVSALMENPGVASFTGICSGGLLLASISNMKEKKIHENIVNNFRSISEQQKIASDKAEEENKKLREEYYTKREEIDKINAEIEIRNALEQAKRKVEYRVGNESLIKIPKDY